MEIQLRTVGKNVLSTEPGDIINKSGPIKWTNRYDCPPGYNFNEDGWIETDIPYPKVSIISPIFLSNKRYSPIDYVLQNLIALRILNNKPHELLLQVILHKVKKHGFIFPIEVIDDIRERSLSISTYDDFPPIDRSILRWDTLWSNTMGRAQINKRRTFHHISDTRENMTISKKYKTIPIKEEAKVTIYAVKEYWSEMGWSAKDRSKKAILEALEDHEDATVLELSTITGLSLPTVRKYLPREF